MRLRHALTALLYGLCLSSPSMATAVYSLAKLCQPDRLGCQRTDQRAVGNRHHRHTPRLDPGGGRPFQGAAGADLSFIPLEAIDHVEVLTDEAAAQYGTDAIAGVINIVLKHNNAGGLLTATGGQYFDQEGNNGDASVSLGRAPLPDFPIANDLQLYGFGTAGYRNAEQIQNYRLPNKIPAVWPYGFSPIEALEEFDFAVTAGIKGTVAGGWNFDLGSTYGSDNDSIYVDDSANIALYNDTGSTPTDFYAGGFVATQWTTTLDLNRNFAVGMACAARSATGFGPLRSPRSITRRRTSHRPPDSCSSRRIRRVPA